MADVKITCMQNGPLEVKGGLTVVDHEGREIALEDGDQYLCRCGQSANKPFCDGSHKRASFDGTLNV